MRLFIETLASYIPAIILKELQNQVENGLKTVPYRTSMDTVCMFCDVSGFTKLAEAMARSGEGAEGLAKNLNQVMFISSEYKRVYNPLFAQYFSLMCKEIKAQGGDIFKYAGDAMIVIWPPEEGDPIDNRIR